MSLVLDPVIQHPGSRFIISRTTETEGCRYLSLHLMMIWADWRGWDWIDLVVWNEPLYDWPTGKRDSTHEAGSWVSEWLLSTPGLSAIVDDSLPQLVSSCQGDDLKQNHTRKHLPVGESVWKGQCSVLEKRLWGRVSILGGKKAI